MVKALKLIYRAYDKNSFLYGSDTVDYTILMNKVSEEQAKEMCSKWKDSSQDIYDFIMQNLM